MNSTASTFEEVGWVPPDSMMAVGEDQIVELLNGGYAVYRKADGVRIQSDTLDGFWRTAGAEPAGSAFDPRLLYDPANRRWFAASIDNSGGPNKILVAVSRSADPTGGWTGFKLPSYPLGEYRTQNGSSYMAAARRRSADYCGRYPDLARPLRMPSS